MMSICDEKVACPIGQTNRHILEILLTRRHYLVAQNHQASIRLHHCNISIKEQTEVHTLYKDTLSYFAKNI